MNREEFNISVNNTLKRCENTLIKKNKEYAPNDDPLNNFKEGAEMSGLSMEQYLQFSGLTIANLKDQVRPEALSRIQSRLVLEQVAKEENIEVSDDEVNSEIEKMAEAYGMEADKLKEYMGENERKSMKKDMAITKAVDLIKANVKERAKAKSKKDAEAATEEE